MKPASRIGALVFCLPAAACGGGADTSDPSTPGIPGTPVTPGTPATPPRLPEAHAVSTGNGVTVGVLDTGSPWR